MNADPRRTYFDEIADRWDRWTDRPALTDRLRHALRAFDLDASETVVDLGCGTGALTQALCQVLGSQASVVAVDFSARMLAEARRHVPDRRVAWIEADAVALPVAPESVHRVFCYSVWPHFPAPSRVAREIWRVLQPGGHLHIWHTDSRGAIDAIHARVGGPIGEDRLVPATALAATLAADGYLPVEAIDDDTRYRVTVRKPDRS